MSGDNVWEKTHRLGAKLFKISGVVAVLGVVFPRYMFLLVLALVLIASVHLIIFSYFEFRAERRN